ncbi:MAG: hypothetical protein JRE65_10245 [Deltaproteobacteria bacterium]|jgi:hypothetical protein|nr:hypothetical protein [Deltaproteobacteria bacterium]
MKSPKIHVDSKHLDRRSGFNRRWIKSDYSGQERRSGKDRREGLQVKDLLVSEDFDTKKMVGFEKLLVSTTIQLEAITRLLLQKRIIKEEELLEMMNQIQSEYHNNTSPR